MTYTLSKENQVYKNTENEAATETLGELLKHFRVAIRILQRHSAIEEYKTALGAASTQHSEDNEDYNREII